jgi:hypothetical protein
MSASVKANPIRTLMIGTPLRTGSLRRRERVEPGPLGEEHGLDARRSVEDEEADLVLGNVNDTVEADARSLSRQLLGGRAGLLLAGARPPASPRAR